MKSAPVKEDDQDPLGAINPFDDKVEKIDVITRVSNKMIYK